MSLIAHCKGCDARALVLPDQTIQAPCDCALRDPAAPWEIVEYVPARELQGAVEAARGGGEGVIQASDEDVRWLRELAPDVAKIEVISPDPQPRDHWPSALVRLTGADAETVERVQRAIDNRRALARVYGGPAGYVRVASV